MRSVVLTFMALFFCVQTATARPLRVVCLQAVWCNIASQLGGDAVSTYALFSRAGSDPHFQQISPEVLRRLSQADLIVRNGAGYDNWADASLKALHTHSVPILTVSGLVPHLARVNPHLFYSVDAVEKFARVYSDTLTRKAPDERAQFAGQLQDFLKKITALKRQVVTARRSMLGRQVAESEPVAAFLLDDLGIQIVNTDFALAMMHHTEPAPRDVAAIEVAFDTHRVAAFIVNPTVTAPAVNVLIERARKARIPIVYSPEYAPPGVLWQDWIKGQIEALEHITN